ncbi:unnamed protein product [Linum trigynum]|uniref:Uncharacterized protein n=1 Tax=Linum trigynum TaxID=586398 RepID=A0AAV2FRW5_9ROSI
MKLKPEFEFVRASFLNRENLQLDGVLGRLIQEETRLRTQEKLDIRPGVNEAVFVDEAHLLLTILPMLHIDPNFNNNGVLPLN